MKRLLAKMSVAALAASLTVSFSASAHRAWLLPSSTVLSGENAYVTFDAAISNTIFHPDHFAMNTSNLVVTSPDGKVVDVENIARGRYRTTFDLKLNKEGTYKVASASSGIRAFWRDEDGNRKMWPGRGEQYKPEEFNTAVPKKATDLRVMQSSRRVETFVTLGAPSMDVFAPTNEGLELIPVTHPNDLFATETATFKLLIDGKPAVGAEAEIVRGGMRYRNDQETIVVVSDENGVIEVTWPQAGMYFIEISYQDDKAKKPATSRNGSYSGTVEVLPL
ncbi:ABC transporter permease [Alteromonas sp. KUL42]|uniref:DUF4198 domain-containing protein n=1 Tax=Alteromonas sp. KUL42 TaxID=2480797 RepID=UPI001036EF1E|nr:DUF4198 domain-containing protein [Alteromonas sp. KUL42]TAP30977.1 DUF4198 domain-containing protein [Alteromonas sp. KUL42]GEA09495.1 ABC transporter permease [Alteromonas sp. KUL42]